MNIFDPYRNLTQEELVELLIERDAEIKMLSEAVTRILKENIELKEQTNVEAE
jgi:hypothetical protein